ncbi:MAG: NAD(P)-dependent oxidoreductase [Verrucomicrobia bacterium]|nr:NAD(P)-dependent oxidoreductase [Verrucomicrobiota bacterium]
MPSPQLVLVTGSAGNVGQTVFHGLLPHFALRAFDRVPTPGATDQHLGDLADRAAVDRAVAGMDTVIHLGGCPRMEADFMGDLIRPNVEGLWHMLDAARLAGVKRFIFASSTNVAFGATGLPQLTPGTVHVFNPYGATKALGENLGRWFHDTYGMEFLAVRIGYFRGIYNDPALREAWLHRIWLGPRDCAEYFRLAVVAPRFGYGVAYACSRCPENYLDLTSARELIGYEPAETVPDAP